MSNTVVGHSSYAIIKTGSSNNLPYTLTDISALTPGVDVFGKYFDGIYVKQLTGKKAYIEESYHTNSSSDHNLSAICSGKVYKNSTEYDAWLATAYSGGGALISFDNWKTSTYNSSGIPVPQCECLRYVYMAKYPSAYTLNGSSKSAGDYCGKYAWVFGRANTSFGFYYSIHDSSCYDSNGFPNNWSSIVSTPDSTSVDDIATIKNKAIIKGHVNTKIHYTSDWYTWATATLPFRGTINGITSNVKNKYVLTHNVGGASSTDFCYFYSSSDGITWTQITGIAVYDSKGVLITSSSITDGNGIVGLDSIFYNGESYVFVGISGLNYYYYTNDLINFYQVELSSTYQMYDIYSNGTYVFGCLGKGSSSGSIAPHDVNRLIVNQIPTHETLVCEKNLNIAQDLTLVTKKNYGLLGTNQIGQIIQGYQYAVCSTSTYAIADNITSPLSTIVCTVSTTITFPTASVDYENYHVEVINPSTITVAFASNSSFVSTPSSLTTYGRLTFICVPYISSSSILYHWIII